MAEQKKNPIAVALGKLAKGIPKSISEQDRKRRRDQMTELNKNRKDRAGQARKAARARWAKKAPKR
jgi:hypothetical protein